MQPLQVVISYLYLPEIFLYLQAATRAMIVSLMVVVSSMFREAAGVDENHSWARYRFIHLGLDKRKVQIGNGEKVTASVPCPRFFHHIPLSHHGKVDKR